MPFSTSGLGNTHCGRLSVYNTVRASFCGNCWKPAALPFSHLNIAAPIDRFRTWYPVSTPNSLTDAAYCSCFVAAIQERYLRPYVHQD